MSDWNPDLSAAPRDGTYLHFRLKAERGPRYTYESAYLWRYEDVAELIERANGLAPEALARKFHDAYERLAPSFGYETRPETREFDPTSANGRLMIAVCGEIAGSVGAAKSIASALPRLSAQAEGGEGWVLVPREPTEAMILASWERGFTRAGDEVPDWRDVPNDVREEITQAHGESYRAMIAAAPSLPVGGLERDSNVAPPPASPAASQPPQLLAWRPGLPPDDVKHADLWVIYHSGDHEHACRFADCYRDRGVWRDRGGNEIIWGPKAFQIGEEPEPSYREVTHWQPLPEPPGASTPGGGATHNTLPASAPGGLDTP